MDHAAFVYDIVEALRPRLVVDVGAGAGIATAAACQSMRDHDVGGLVYGIDSWSDDDGKSENDPARWADLNGFLRAHFRGVAYLMRMPTRDGPGHFTDGSVGILRLNVARTDGLLAPLVEAWLPKLAPGGVLVCPGVNDEKQPTLADEWKREVEGRGGCTFPHGGGLGLFSAPGDGGSAPATELIEFLASLDSGDREALARFYAHVDRHHALCLELSGKWTALGGKK
jgi:hypothetical protein